MRRASCARASRLGAWIHAAFPVESDEPSAVRAALAADGTLATTGLPGVLLVLSHEDRAGVVAPLTELGFEALTGTSPP